MATYQARCIKILDYIDTHLDTDLNIDELCAYAQVSKYHFHRQCSVFFGVSLITLVRLLRLKRAAYQLAYRNDSRIIDIALSSGYDSHEAFSRGFKKHFKQTPSDFRQSPNWEAWQVTYAPILHIRNQIMSDNMDYTVQTVTFPHTPIAVMVHKGAMQRLGITIQKFIAWRKANQLPPNKSQTFNLLYDDPTATPADEFRLGLACSLPRSIDTNDTDVTVDSIPAGLCAKIRHVGSDDTIGLAVNYLYGEWLSQSDFELRDFPLFFERVRFFPEVLESEMITDIYLPIQ
ncbi:helix-turn-helix domain-containing protein [Alteromonas sp. 345S023]|uniref:Helix-turn-helix domain-containing protein n=1 Tax=Alteromonas profundi TaxID=2696062 RepID=A0A7X5LQ98_9ALTE|nr:AraC family transcriptional regulator [Alteromonas profundi]NDV93034.1 helix-turn-helix domain-containing protein [Alteromonas profundi]